MSEEQKKFDDLMKTSGQGIARGVAATIEGEKDGAGVQKGLQRK